MPQELHQCSSSPFGDRPALSPSLWEGHAVKHFVAKLVESFGGLCNAAESLDDFRYRKAFSYQRKRLHSVVGRGERSEGRVK